MIHSFVILIIRIVLFWCSPMSMRALLLLLLLQSSHRITAVQTTKSNIDETVIQLYWYAPFLSGGGYCSEAIAFASGLSTSSASNVSLNVRHHGDTPSQSFFEGLRESEQLMLQHHGISYDLSGRPQPSRTAPADIVICHSEPGAWDAPTARYYTNPCPPHASRGVAYTIGRSKDLYEI